MNSVSRLITTLFRFEDSECSRCSVNVFGSVLGVDVMYEDRGPPSSSGTGDGSGVDVPDRTSLRPRKPLCNFVLGAGRPLRKCSSSASVPLSLDGVASRDRAGKEVRLRGWLSSTLDRSSDRAVLEARNLSEGSSRSEFWWW